MPEYMSIVLFIVVFALLLLGFPVAFTLGGVSLIFGYFTFGMNFFQLLPLRALHHLLVARKRFNHL